MLNLVTGEVYKQCDITLSCDCVFLMTFKICKYT